MPHTTPNTFFCLMNRQRGSRSWTPYPSWQSILVFSSRPKISYFALDTSPSSHVRGLHASSLSTNPWFTILTTSQIGLTHRHLTEGAPRQNVAASIKNCSEAAGDSVRADELQSLQRHITRNKPTNLIYSSPNLPASKMIDSLAE